MYQHYVNPSLLEARVGAFLQFLIRIPIFDPGSFEISTSYRLIVEILFP